jgi:hypothetical protein
MNKIRRPPRKIKIKRYENQNEFIRRPEKTAIKMVCATSIRPKDKG